MTCTQILSVLVEMKLHQIKYGMCFVYAHKVYVMVVPNWANLYSFYCPSRRDVGQSINLLIDTKVKPFYRTTDKLERK